MKKLLFAVCAAAFAVPALAIGPPVHFGTSPGYHYATPASSRGIAAPALAAADGRPIPPPLYFVDKRPPKPDIALGGAMVGSLVDSMKRATAISETQGIGGGSSNRAAGKTQTGLPFVAAT